ncbi:MAG: hypothetical protein WDN76_04205 [Alphaproteobacteria bacterium]
MSRIFAGASLALALVSLSGVASAEQCRNAAGKFIACPTSTAPARCKDASGKFAKCGTPGATPMIASVQAAGEAKCYARRRQAAGQTIRHSRCHQRESQDDRHDIDQAKTLM